MVSIYLYSTDRLIDWVAKYTLDEDTILQLSECAFGFLVGKESRKNIKRLDYFDTGIVDKNNITFLKHLDNFLLGKEYEPDWNLYDNSRSSFQFDAVKVEEAVSRLKETGDFFYLHVLLLVFFGGITEQYHANLAIKESGELLSEMYMKYKSFIVAKKFTKEFSSQEVMKAASNYHLASPIDPEIIPPYSIGSSSVVKIGGNYYLTDDILKAITAAGGMAQALERQDLEGGMENAASKQTRPRKLSFDSDETDKKDGA